MNGDERGERMIKNIRILVMEVTKLASFGTYITN